ncbi:hypothetical protein [Roseobacter sp. HKCC-CH-9208]|uniref:hypothetical protein n=1 Tax=Roseobacter sp. HKCC-CH-9208 TaxID=3120339 RepID=UPI0030EC68AD
MDNSIEAGINNILGPVAMIGCKSIVMQVVPRVSQNNRDLGQLYANSCRQAS